MQSLERYLSKNILCTCLFFFLRFMYKGEISWWIFKVVFLEMRILQIGQYVMGPTK